jgi:ABC-2 type transport system permease protein
VANLVHKELIQFRRDWLLAAFVLLAPVLQLVLLARSTGEGVTNLPAVVVDLDHSRLSRQLLVGLDNTQELEVLYTTEDMDRMRSLLDAGQARLAVVIPPGFARELGTSAAAQPIQLVADATNTVAASVALGAAAGVIERLGADLAASFGLAVPEFIDFRSNVRFNPTLDFRDFTIPAQLGFIVFQVTLAVAALGLTREKELGTLEQLLVTPLHHLELALGKVTPAVAIGQLNFIVMFAISRLVFQAPMNGSLPLLLGLTLLFVMAVANWGLVISCISHTQQQAILFIFIQAMVEITLSGYLVPVENMPGLLRAIATVSPLQHYLAIIRNVMLKGTGLDALWPQALALVILAVANGLIALRALRSVIGQAG